MKKVLWIGTVVDDNQAIKEPAISLAANYWQLGMMNALVANDYLIEIIGIVPQRTFPYGKLRSKSTVFQSEFINGKYFSYFNIAGIRSVMLKYLYYYNTANRLKDIGKIDLVIIYNIVPDLNSTIKFIKRKTGATIIGIVADVFRNKLKQHFASEVIYDKLLYLSYSLYLDSKHPGKLFLEGGIERIHSVNVDFSIVKKIIFYSGGIGGHGGLDLLLDAYKYFCRNDIELWVCGKGYNKKLFSMINKDNSIKYFGVLTKTELTQKAKCAYVLVNPRPSHYENNYFNFPSKILEYLSYSRIIISTKTAGLSPDYLKALEILPEETPEILCDALKRVLNYSSLEYQSKIYIQNSLAITKLWENQISKVIDIV